MRKILREPDKSNRKKLKKTSSSEEIMGQEKQGRSIKMKKLWGENQLIKK